MDSAKNFLFSKTIWGIIIMFVGKLFPKLGITDENSGATVATVLEVLGGLLAVIGRFTAKREITIGPSV